MTAFKIQVLNVNENSKKERNEQTNKQTEGKLNRRANKRRTHTHT